MSEELSALVDGEANDLERERVMRALKADPAQRQRWERYHLASTAIRRELEFVVSPGLADRIQERLAAEQLSPAGWGLSRARVARLAAGFAIAASVATVAILSLPIASKPVTAPLAKSGLTTPGSSHSALADSRPAAEQQRALNPYLVHHAEFTPAAGINGMTNYARVLGNDDSAAGPDTSNAE